MRFVFLFRLSTHSLPGWKTRRVLGSGLVNDIRWWTKSRSERSKKTRKKKGNSKEQENSQTCRDDRTVAIDCPSWRFLFRAGLLATTNGVVVVIVVDVAAESSSSSSSSWYLQAQTTVISILFSLERHEARSILRFRGKLSPACSLSFCIHIVPGQTMSEHAFPRPDASRTRENNWFSFFQSKNSFSYDSFGGVVLPPWQKKRELNANEFIAPHLELPAPRSFLRTMRTRPSSRRLNAFLLNYVTIQAIFSNIPLFGPVTDVGSYSRFGQKVSLSRDLHKIFGRLVSWRVRPPPLHLLFVKSNSTSTTYRFFQYYFTDTRKFSVR